MTGPQHLLGQERSVAEQEKECQEREEEQDGPMHQLRPEFSRVGDELWPVQAAEQLGGACRIRQIIPPPSGDLLASNR